MNSLFVYYKSRQIGALTRNADLVYSFKYTNEWLSYENRFPLSLTLKLEEKVYENKNTLSFFENLLPEGDAKVSLEKSQQVHGVFDFLSRFGQDCAGAITITGDPNYKENLLNTEKIKIETNKIYKALDEKKSVVEMIAEKNPGYLSIAGAQDKFPALYRDGNFYIPKHGGPTTHIIKMPIYRSNIKDSGYNELFCMNLARKVGFEVPHCGIFQGQHPLFIIERYDRFTDSSGLTMRLHQQDFCQALGLTSEFKYEDKGGPTIKNHYDLIIDTISARTKIKSLGTYLDWIAFNLQIGNNDTHSKNISLLTKNKKYELAPLYDLLCTSIYPKLQKKFAFTIGEKNDYTRIGPREFKKLDNDLGLKEGTFQERFQQIHDLIFKYKDEVAKEISDQYGKIKILPKLNTEFTNRAATFKNQRALK